MKRYLLPVLLVFAVSCSDGFPPEFPAPEFSVKNLYDGKDITYSDYRGKPVLIYFFASW